MNPRRYTTYVFFGLAVLICASVVPGQTDSQSLRRILTEKASFLPADLDALDRGEVVVLAQKTQDKQEVSVTGVVRMNGLLEISMDDFRASLTQRSNKSKTKGGRFGSPPDVADLASFELSEKDLKDLRECRVGNCDINLSADAIKRFQNEVDWNAPDHPERAATLMREILVEYVRGYAEKGDKALGRLDNRRNPVDLAAVHRGILDESLLIKELAPALYDYLANYPAGSLPDVRNEFSWSTVDFGLKPMITLSHSAAHSFSDANGQQRVLVSKQFYANHYLDSSIAFTFLLRMNGADGPETYLIFTDRSRSDALDGLLGSFTRKVVTKEAFERVETILKSAQTRLEGGSPQDAQPAPQAERPGMLDRLKEWAQEPLAILAALAIGALILFRLTRARSTR